MKQLKTRFGDVKFAGIAVEDRNIEQSEKLVDIFVMPDVVEEVRTRSLEPELLLEKTGSRQEESLREQQQLAQLENRSGRKFLAAELLSQNQSQKAVLLGAPGVGKTTLLSYFAVMLAQSIPPTPLTKGGKEGKKKECEKNVLGLDADTDWLPILIRIRDLAREPDDRDILDLARQFAEKTMSVKKLPEGFFEYWLEDGRALILLDDLRRLMKSLACWIHKEGNTGEKEGGTLIEQDELIEQLSKRIKTLKKIQPYEAKAEAQRLVDFIRERTGLLNEQGQDYYGFVHKTFQEYLCAQDIIEEAEEEDDDDIILKHIKEYLHDAHWREVLLLLIAQQKGKKATKAIRAILNKGSDYEQWLHRNLFFACRCLAENPERLRSADNDPSPEIVKRLVDLEVDDSGRVGGRVRRQVFQLLCSLNETEFQEEVLQCLNDKKDRIDEYRLLNYQAALGEKEAVIKTWLEKLKDQESGVRSIAAYALGNLGKKSCDVLPAVAQWIEQHQDSEYIGDGIDALWALVVGE